MDNEKMAHFIAQLRKSKKMTQKELAAKLSVTDKAVSKWERGLSCPDIALLAPLAEILGVTTGELLSGEKTAAAPSPEANAIADTALHYADTVAKNHARRSRTLLAEILTFLSASAMIVCSICDYAINGRLTWDWYVISSLVFFLLIALPVILWKKHGPFTSLLLLSISIFPYLFALEKLIGIDGLLLPLAGPVTAVALAYLWVGYLLFHKAHFTKSLAFAIFFAVGIPTAFCINWIVSRFTGEPLLDVWDVFTYAPLAAASVVFLLHNRLHKTTNSAPCAGELGKELK